MTRAEQALARRWRSALLACVLVALAGAVLIIWARINSEATRADQLAAEADRRGTAVTTLATDVRTLREQVKAEGKTPAVPDPAKAIDNLRDRAKVPVPIPGPRGLTGPAGRPGQDATGAPGKDGTNGRDGSDSTVPGPQGPAGEDGADSTVPGPAGPPGPAGKDGADGRDGIDGKDGRDGQTCPSGYSLQPSSTEPGALVCKSGSGGSSPSDPQSPSGNTAAYLPRRRA